MAKTNKNTNGNTTCSRADHELPEDWEATDCCVVCSNSKTETKSKTSTQPSIDATTSQNYSTQATKTSNNAQTLASLDSLGEALQRAAPQTATLKTSANQPLNFDQVFKPPPYDMQVAETMQSTLTTNPYLNAALQPYAQMMGYSPANYLQMLQWSSVMQSPSAMYALAGAGQMPDFAMLNNLSMLANNNSSICTENTNNQTQNRDNTRVPSSHAGDTLVDNLKNDKLKKGNSKPVNAENVRCNGMGYIKNDHTAHANKSNQNRMQSFKGESQADANKSAHFNSSISGNTKPLCSPTDEQPLDLSVGRVLDRNNCSLNKLVDRQSPKSQETSQVSAQISPASDSGSVNNNDVKRESNDIVISTDPDKPSAQVSANKRAYTQLDLEQAVKDIDTKKMGTRRAAIKYGIPRSTLRNKMAKLKATENGMPSPKRSRRAISANSNSCVLNQAECSNDSSSLLPVAGDTLSPTPSSVDDSMNEGQPTPVKLTESPESDQTNELAKCTATDLSSVGQRTASVKEVIGDRIASTIEQTVIAAQAKLVPQGLDFSLKTLNQLTTTGGSRPATADIDDRRATDSTDDAAGCSSAHSADDTKKNQEKTRPKRGQYRKYDKKALDEAVNAVRRGEMKVHRAGSYYGVPHSTLEYKVKERNINKTTKKGATETPSIDATSSIENIDSSGQSVTVTSVAVSHDAKNSAQQTAGNPFTTADNRMTESAHATDYQCMSSNDVALMNQAAAAMAVWSQAFAAASANQQQTAG